MPATASAIEEPRFEVVDSTDAYELRRYDSFLVAETEVSGDFGSSGGKAFRILAGYIFGNNQPQEKMSMTAPVISSEAGTSRSGEKMAMTAPVVSRQAEGDEQRYIYQFVMESKYSLETLPQPLDNRITIKKQPQRLVAAHRFGGFWREKNIDAHKARFLEALANDGIEVIGKPELARYDAPFKPWFLRRNEILVKVKAPSGP